ncbi:hypothetical protein ACLOJK_031764 [Asimina triloba]
MVLGCICINESMFKDGVRLSSKFDISEVGDIDQGGAEQLEDPLSRSMVRGMDRPTHSLASKPIPEGSVKVKLIEGNVEPERFILTIKEVTKLKVCERGQKGVLKRPFTLIKEEITAKVKGVEAEIERSQEMLKKRSATEAKNHPLKEKVEQTFREDSEAPDLRVIYGRTSKEKRVEVKEPFDIKGQALVMLVELMSV